MVTIPGTRYPHLLQLTVAGQSIQDAEGNWYAAPSTVVETACRIEPKESRLDGLNPGADGSVLNYNWVIFMPQGAPLVKVGATAVIKDGDLNTIASATVKRFSRGQLNARAWL